MAPTIFTSVTCRWGQEGCSSQTRGDGFDLGRDPKRCLIYYSENLTLAKQICSPNTLSNQRGSVFQALAPGQAHWDSKECEDNKSLSTFWLWNLPSSFPWRCWQPFLDISFLLFSLCSPSWLPTSLPQWAPLCGPTLGLGLSSSPAPALLCQLAHLLVQGPQPSAPQCSAGPGHPGLSQGASPRSSGFPHVFALNLPLLFLEILRHPQVPLYTFQTFRKSRE